MLSRLMETFDPDDISVITRKCAGYIEFDNNAKYKIRRMPSLSLLPGFLQMPLRALFSLLFVLREMIFDKPDLMLCGYAKGDAPFGWLSKKAFGVPYVVFAYGTDVVRYKDRGGLIRFWLKGADLVVTISRAVHNFLDQFTKGEAKIITVPLGCGVSGVPPDPPLLNWRGIDLKRARVVLTVCRLTERKGVDKTIAALSLLVDKFPDIIYFVVGQGADKSRLENMALKHGISDKVIFTGRISDQDLLRFYDRAEVFILASREIKGDIEGFGLVFVEAGAFGTPVIGGNSGGVGDAVEHEKNGLLVDPESSEAIARGIERLLTDKVPAKNLGNEGRRRAAHVFTWENCKKALMDGLSNEGILD